MRIEIRIPHSAFRIQTRERTVDTSATEGVPEEIQAFYTEILNVQQRARRDLEGRFSLDPKPAEAGQPLLDLEGLNVDENALEAIFGEICTVLGTYGKEDLSGASRIREAVREGRVSLKDLIKAAIGGDAEHLERLSDAENVEQEVLFFLARETGRPLFELCAAQVRAEEDLEEYAGGSCPVCGNLPALAKLGRAEGQRTLWCAFCGTEWRYPRLQCPFCSNDDHDALQYIFFDEEMPYRVDVCERCKRYVKTVDERKIPETKEVNLPEIHMVTLDLDVIAEQEGYERS